MSSGHRNQGEGKDHKDLDFYIECVDEDRRSAIEAGLNRLGCRVEESSLRLHVWLPENRPSSILSARELKLVSLASKGHTDKEIALMLNVSAYTVRSYWVRVCHKLDAANRTQAVGIVFAHEPRPETAA